MTKQVYKDLQELESAYKKLSCSIQQNENRAIIAYNNGFNDALRAAAKIAREAKYPEYLEEDLINFLNDKGVKLWPQ